MKKYLIIFLLLLHAALVVLVQPVHAANDTEDDEASSSATTEELKKRIEKVVDEKREQIKGVIEDLLSKKTGFIGEITRISEEAITVKSSDTTSIIPLAESLQIIADDKAAEVTSLEVGNWAIVMGNRDGQGIEAEYLIASDDTLRPRNQTVIIGSITAITRTKLTIAVRGTEEARDFDILRSSVYEDVEGEPATATEFVEDLNVLVIALEGDDGWELQTVRSLAPFEEN